MVDPDGGYRALSDIYDEFGTFCHKRGQVTEADTRAKVIDTILKEALGWPEQAIRREDNIKRGYIDYTLSSPSRNLLLVEAKREGIPFDVPKSLQTRRRYKVSGSIRTNENIREAVEQAQHYCVEAAIRYAVVTNGYAWLVFRAIREDKPWREGDILVFESAGFIKKNFTDFWNTFSYSAVLEGGLDAIFSPDIMQPRFLKRPIDLLVNPDAPLLRNRFHMQLHPFVDNIFRDIGAEGQIEILRSCYVYNKSLLVIDSDLKLVIEDTIPRFMKVEGAVDTTSGPKDAGSMGEAIEEAIGKPSGTLFLLLGGIGCGKTTFLKRFFNYIAKPFIEKNALWYYVDFLAAPLDAEKVELFLYDSVLEQIRSRYGNLKLESRDSLKVAYEDKILALKEGFLDAERLPAEEYERKISEHLEKWMLDFRDYVPRVVRAARLIGRTTVLCIDNVDQLSPSYQARIFLLAQWAVRQMEAVVIVALREESYYAASIQRAFTAYNNRKFHIASPPFRLLISSRLKYCRRMLTLPQEKILIKLGTGIRFDKVDISKFFDIIEYSIFSKNRNIARLIEALSFGNMRAALDMFATFLYSGATNVDKMLKIYDRDGQYFVAFHEFAKSIILGDRKYYRDSESRVLNVFDCGPEKNSSHFTSIRLLALLLGHADSTNPEGRGFVRLDDVFDAFLDTFDNEMDLTKTAKRLLQKQLLQVDTRSPNTIEGASYIRISSAGWYYFKYLLRAFAYLDLVFQDTPINEKDTVQKLRQYIVDVDEIPETQGFLDQRVSSRFERVEVFLDYLKREEEKERKRFSLDTVRGVLGLEFMQDIWAQYRRERIWIEERIKKNAERQPDDILSPDDKIPDFPIAESSQETEETLEVANESPGEGKVIE